MRGRNILSILVAVLLLGQTANALQQAQEANASLGAANRALTLLRTCPVWDGDIMRDAGRRRRLEQSLAALDHFPTPVLRRAVLTYLQDVEAGVHHPGQPSASPPIARGKVFVLLRYIFRIPDNPRWFAPVASGYRGGRGGLWPLGRGPRGHLTIIDSFRGYMGPAYDGRQEFDYLSRHFRRRREQGHRSRQRRSSSQDVSILAVNLNAWPLPSRDLDAELRGLMVWDSQGTSGYQDLLEENTP
jgi:hypothetical protein